MIQMKALTKTFLTEFLRERILLVGLFIAGALSIMGLLLGSVSFDEKARIAFDLSMAALHFVSLGLVIFFGSFTLQREIEKQTCLLVLSRPVSRIQFYLSKYFAIAILVLIFQAIVSLALIPMVGKEFVPLTYFQIWMATYLEILVVLAYALYASVWLRGAIALFGAIGVYLIGHWIPDLLFFAEKSESSLFKNLAEVVKWLFPHLYRLNFRSFYFFSNPINMEDYGLALLHGVAWIVFFSVVGCLLWRKKDLVA